MRLVFKTAATMPPVDEVRRWFLHLAECDGHLIWMLNGKLIDLEASAIHEGGFQFEAKLVIVSNVRLWRIPLPRVLPDWDAVEAFLNRYVTPARFSPKGRPIYNINDVAAALKREKVRLPD